MALAKVILGGLVISLILNVPAFSQADETPRTLYQKGVAIAKKNPKQAYAVFVDAIKLARQKGDRDVHVDALNAVSQLAINDVGDFDQVFAWSKEGLQSWKDVKPNAAIAELHYNVAELYNLSNEIDTALFHYEKALKIWSSLASEWTPEVAKCYHGKGDVYKYNKLDFYEAQINYERALLIREKIGFKDTLTLYKNFYSLAATYRSQLDFEKAISYGNQAMGLAKTLDVERVEATTGMVANIYRDMHETGMAKKYYLDALSLNKKTKIPENKAWYYMCLGETLKKDSSYNDAMQCFLQSYPIYKSPDSGNRNLFVYLLLHMAEAYSFLKDDTSFKRTIKEVFSELSSNDLRGTIASEIWVLLGEHHDRKKHYDSALYYYQEALKSSIPTFKSTKPTDNPTEEMIGFFYYSYDILVKKATALRSKFSITKDIRYLDESIATWKLSEKLLSKQRNTLDMDKSRWEFLDSQYDLYEGIISSLYEGSGFLPLDTVNNLAFRYFEQSKSRSLADALAQTEHSKKISSQDSLFHVHTELRRSLLSVQDKINRELEKSVSSKVVPALREEIVAIDRIIQNCKRAIEEKYPGYFNVRYGYTAPDLTAVQNILADKGHIILEFFWGVESVYALGISHDKILFRRIGQPDSVKLAIDVVLKHLETESSILDKQAFKLFAASAYRLNELLISPFKSLLDGNKRLQVIPDGPLCQLPFEILLEEPEARDMVDYRSLKYLIRSYGIGYAYSSTMLTHKFGKVTSKPSFLAIGFTGGSRLRSPDVELEDIQGAEEELDALAKRFKSGKFLMGAEATEANFKELSPEYDIIHLAIHGKGDVEKSFSSSLYFRSKFDSLDDGELHDYELYGLKLKALMAVLSACESGIGRDYRGEGMISMASAFTYSGCENILMSLWKVNDKASTVLMDDFYGHLVEGRTIDDALRQAKLDYLDRSDELTADPRIWAPLVAYGSLDKVFKRNDAQVIMYAVIGVTMLILILYLMRRKGFI